jgi:hypothetical protein
MKPPDDLLEAELQELRPRGISPGLERSIAERLTAKQATSRPWRWSTGLAGVLAAACLAAVLLGWSDRDSDLGQNGLQPPAPVATNGDAKPSVLAYRRVLAHSPHALDALLDKHAARTLPADAERVQIRAFTRSDEQYASLGEEL